MRDRAARFGVLGGRLLLVIVAASAIPRVAEAAPPKPSTVRLDNLGIDVQLPANWKKVGPYRENDAWDEVGKDRDSVRVRIEPLSASCADAIPAIATLMGKLEKKPGVLPGGYSPAYIVDALDPTLADVLACADVSGGLLLARYGTGTNRKPSAEATRVLSAVLASARAAPRAGAGEEREVHLAGLGVKVRLPASASAWGYFDVTNGAGLPEDGFVRVRAGSPPIAFRVLHDDLEKCENGSGARPPYMPARFHVVRSADDQAARACTPTVKGSIETAISLPGPLSEADAADLRTVLDAVALGAGLGAPGEAEPTRVVRFPALGVDVALPFRDAEWELDTALSKFGTDRLKRVRPNSPYAGIYFRVERGKVCNGPPANEGDIVDRPASFPQSLHPKVVRKDEKNAQSIYACLPIATGSVNVNAYIGKSYNGDLAPEDVAVVGTVLRAVASAVGSDEVTHAGPPSQPSAPEKLTLSVLGIEIPAVDGPNRWTAQRFELNSGEQADLLERVPSPNTPLLRVRLGLLSGGCAARVGTTSTRARATTTKPPFVPPGYAELAYIDEPDETSRVGAGLFCADLPDGRALEAAVVYNGSLWLPDATAAGPVMSKALAALREKYRPVASAPTPAYTPSRSPARSSTYFDERDAPGFGPTRASLFAHRLTPDDDRLDGVLGGMLRLEGMSPSSDADGIDFAMEWAVGAGYDARSYFSYDLSFALGFSVGLGPVMVAPLIGLGVDGTTGGDEAAYHLPSAAFYSFGARARALLGDEFAVDLGAARRMRSSDGDTVMVDGVSIPIDGSKVSVGRLDWVFRGDAETALGVRYAGYGDATQFTLALGRSF